MGMVEMEEVEMEMVETEGVEVGMVGMEEVEMEGAATEGVETEVMMTTMVKAGFLITGATEEITLILIIIHIESINENIMSMFL